MDYKYINQLLNKYWEGTSSLEEERILRAFFSQKDVPGSFLAYKELFVYEQQEQERGVMSADFDDRLLALVGEDTPVKAHKLTLTRRLLPLFKAAAMVAIILTLGNAMQVSFDTRTQNSASSNAINTGVHHGSSVAMTDSANVDTMKQSNLVPQKLVVPMD